MDQTVAKLRGWIDNLLASGRYRRVIDVCAQTLKLARRDGNRAAEIVSLSGLAAAHHYTGAYREAWVLSTGAVDLAERGGEAASLADALCARALVSLEARLQPYDALADYEAAVALATDAGDERTVAEGLLGMARSLTTLGRYRTARRCAEEAIVAAGDASAPMIQYAALAVQGNAQRAEGHPNEAVQTLRQALDLVQEAGYTTLEGITHYYIGMLLARSPDHVSGALTAFRQVEVIADDIGYPTLGLWAYQEAGTTHERLGDWESARDAYTQMLHTAEDTQNPLYEAAAYFNFGKLRFIQDAYGPALSDFERAQLIAREQTNPLYEALALEWLAQSHARLGEYDEAIHGLNAARSVYNALDDESSALRLTGTLVLLYLRRFYERLLRLIGLHSHDDA